MRAALTRLRGFGTLRKAVRRAREWRNRRIDWWMGINTQAFHRGAQQAGRFGDGVDYQALDYVALWRFMKPLDLGPQDVVFDIGCGMGRIMCAFARMPIRKCVGVELDAELAEQARKNAKSLRGRRAEIEVRTEDACTTDFSDCTIVFMFNPFGAETLREMVESLRRAVEARPRIVRLGYFNPIHNKVLEECGWLRCYDTRRWPFSDSLGTYWTNEPPDKSGRVS